MTLHLGVKSDPIESRHSYTWLFDLMREHGVGRLQLGSSFPMFFADDAYFTCLRGDAESRGVLIDSIFTSHRELGGFSSGDPLLEAATRRGWERIIRVAALVGARSAGSNAGIVLRDQPELLETGVRRFLDAMKDLLRVARSAGLSALTVEPMSSVWEYPSTPEQIRRLTSEADGIAREIGGAAVPLVLCGDISHGVADADGKVLYDNWSLFELEIPWMWEFHIKNTDAIFNSTFGFGPVDRKKGIVDLARLKKVVDANAARFPAAEVTGYLEIGGPKTGREYTDRHLEGMLVESIEAMKTVFGGKETAS